MRPFLPDLEIEIDAFRPAAMAISGEVRRFCVTLGEDISSLRRARSLTQTQLAQALSVAQQTLQFYEVGRRRIPVPALPTVARSLSVSLEELFGEGHRAARTSAQVQQQIEAIAQLPKARQRFVSRMRETVLAGDPHA